LRKDITPDTQAYQGFVFVVMLHKVILMNGCRIAMESPQPRRRRGEDLEWKAGYAAD